MRPMPFCPSFEPWKKLTPVQVSTMRARIGHGGGSLPLGASWSAGKRRRRFNTRSRTPASAKPSSGEIRRASRTLITWLQSRPETPRCRFMSWLASPTPMIEPTMVCELDAGRPNHHVPRFHRIAAISSANTMAKPVPELTFRISSTGSSVMTAKATVPDDNSTPVRLHSPDHTTAILRRQRVGVDHRGHGVGGVVKAIHEFEPERDEQRQAQQHIAARRW